MSDSYDDYESKIQLAEYAWEKRVVKTEHDRAVQLGKAYERGWNAALAQQEPVAWPDDMLERINAAIQRITSGQGCKGCMRVPPDKTDPDLVLADIRKLIKSSQPASKPWVGLTDEEINSVRYQRDWTAPWTDTTFAHAIEAKLREKNA